jgi:hypothetical protein
VLLCGLYFSTHTLAVDAGSSGTKGNVKYACVRTFSSLGGTTRAEVCFRSGHGGWITDDWVGACKDSRVNHMGWLYT